MSKIIFVFLVICFINDISSSSALSHGHSSSHGHSAHVSYESHHPATHTTVHHESSDYIELYSAFANGIFNFFVKLFRTKVEIFLWLKNAIINLLSNGVGHLRHIFVHNGDFANGIIHTLANLLKMLLTNNSHFGVSHINRIFADAEHEYITNGHY